MRPLTAKERAFTAAYVADPGRNASAAARNAGYSDARKAGHLALRRPRVQAHIARLEDRARKRVTARVIEPEVLAPMPTPNANLVPTAAEESAVASRSEALAVATNIIRTHETRKVGDIFRVSGEGESATLVANAEKIGELPLTAVKGLKHDHAGDLELKLADPLAAGRLILDDHHRAQEGARSQGGEDLATALVQVLREAALRERKPVTNAPAQRPRVAESPGTRRIS